MRDVRTQEGLTVFRACCFRAENFYVLQIGSPFAFLGNRVKTLFASATFPWFER